MSVFRQLRLQGTPIPTNDVWISGRGRRDPGLLGFQNDQPTETTPPQSFFFAPLVEGADGGVEFHHELRSPVGGVQPEVELRCSAGLGMGETDAYRAVEALPEARL